MHRSAAFAFAFVLAACQEAPSRLPNPACEEGVNAIANQARAGTVVSDARGLPDTGHDCWTHRIDDRPNHQRRRREDRRPARRNVGVEVRKRKVRRALVLGRQLRRGSRTRGLLRRKRRRLHGLRRGARLSFDGPTYIRASASLRVKFPHMRVSSSVATQVPGEVASAGMSKRYSREREKRSTSRRVVRTCVPAVIGPPTSKPDLKSPS